MAAHPGKFDWMISDQREGILTGVDVGDELGQVSGDRDDHGDKEDRPDDRRTDDGGEDGAWRFPTWVLGFLGERARRIESIDHEQGHEHGGQEDTRLVAEARTEVAGVGETRQRLVVIEDQQHQRENHHAEDLEHHAGVVDERHDPDAENAEQGRAQENERGDVALGVEVGPDAGAQHVVEQRDEDQRHSGHDRRHREDAREQIDPAREPRISPI